MNLYGVQSAEKNARCSVKKTLPVTGIVVPLLCCGLAFPGVSFSMQSGNTEAILGITFSAEHDDNIKLSSETDPESETEGDAEGEMVYHVMPSIDLTHAFGEHVLKFDLAGDSRSGGGNVDSGLNIDTSVGLGLNFAGGLALSLVDTYAKDEFDMDLYDESDVSENQSNEYGFDAKYSFGRRLRAEAGYKHLWQEYNNDPKDIEYDTDTVTGKFTAPVAERLEAYVSGSFESTESDPASSQNSDTMSGVLGVRWEGPSILSGWIEGGYGDIDYETGTDDDDYSEAIGDVGVEVAFTPRSYMELSVGRNNYGDIKYSALLSHNYLDKMKINLSANQSTARSYSTTSSERTYDVSLFRLSLATKFLERFEAGLTASYQMQDTTDEVDTFVGRATLEYPIQEWVKVGAHYQYATRTADKDTTKDYDDNRIGFFATFSL